MKITLFTSNQPRHLALVEALTEVAEELYVVQECNTVFPGQVQGFFQKTEVMRDYFARVVAAEEKVFGRPRFVPANARQLAVRMGDVNRLDLHAFGPALDADIYVIFGASYIKGPLCQHLVANRAYNIHMGCSPYYRGSSTNFWALFDGNPQLVGATIHLLTKGLDSGPILFHALPRVEAVDPFVLGMKAVRAAHAGLVESLSRGELSEHAQTPQDRSLELRYSRHADFGDEAARAYLDRAPSPSAIERALQQRDLSRFVQPFTP